MDLLQVEAAREATGGTGPLDGLVQVLAERGGRELPHAGERSLLDHLKGTAELLRRWGQPGWLQAAGLLHSIYGTDAYAPQLVPLSDRGAIAAVAGERAERLAYLFSRAPRDAVPLESPAAPIDVTGEDLSALAIIHMANLLEQPLTPDGSPGRLLARVGALHRRAMTSRSLTSPAFAGDLVSLSPDDESLAVDSYWRALDGFGQSPKSSGYLAQVIALVPVLPEPYAWQAALALRSGDPATARWWAGRAAERLRSLGASWDKRLTSAEWGEVVDRLSRCEPSMGARLGLTQATPKSLLHALRQGPPLRGSLPLRLPDRFADYVAAFPGSGDPLQRRYPRLRSDPWYNAGDLPLARALQERFSEVGAELALIAAERFQTEAEDLERDGHWDVRFLLERGRRNREVCDRCPVTTEIISTMGGVDTMAGLAYVSRLRPGTHIKPHRGPTNMRVRCHLGLQVPDGDCGIRVDGATKRWTVGECLVFSDYFEHEAWNFADASRVVLIVDLWNPELSRHEVRNLEALHRYATSVGSQLHRYWADNDRSAAAGS